MNPERELERGRELPSSAVPIAEALRDVRLATGQPEATGHVSVAVAAAVRAAVDWLTADGFDARPPRLAAEDSALELRFDAVTHGGLEAAAEVLESADSNLGPSESGSGWTLRAPVLAERDTYLMIEQGPLGLAVPWHAVVRVRLLPAETIDATARRHSYAVLLPYAGPVAPQAEHLAVLVGLGLRRALLIGDRLIWRMPADRVESGEPSPAPGLTRQVRSDEGTNYWVVEPRHALHGVGPMLLPAPTQPPRREPQPAKHAAVPPAPERGRILVLRPEDVEPFGDPETETPVESMSEAIAAEVEVALETLLAPAPETIAAPVTPETSAAPESTVMPETIAAPESAVAPETSAEPATSAAPAPPAIAEEAAAAEAPAPPDAPAAHEPVLQSPAAPSPAPRIERHALVAEDSMTARIFLTRMLEQRGFTVRPVASAAELGRAIAAERFGVVFADVELPDQRGAVLLAPLLERMRIANTPLVALVRDPADAETARSAGVAHALRKPFEGHALDRLLDRLGVSPVSR